MIFSIRHVACNCLRNRNWNPRVDIYEDEDAIVLKAELPGVEKDNIVVDVEGRVLTLKGERSSDNDVKEESYYRRERTFGSFERRFNLPDNVDPEKITADYKDGILKVGDPQTRGEQAQTDHCPLNKVHLQNSWT